MDYVHLCDSAAGALFDRHRRGVVGTSFAAQGQRGRNERRHNDFLFVVEACCGSAGDWWLLLGRSRRFALSRQTHFNGAKALEYARQFVAIGPRWPTSPGHAQAEAFLLNQFKHDQLEEDAFTANTPIGPVAMRNFIVRFPGKKDGVIVLASHYETNYWLRNINFVGANDGGSTTGLLMAIADQLRADMAHDKTDKLEGYSVWLVFFDGEEAIQSWSDSDSTYGSRHLAAKWGRDGTLGRIKAFILADMIGDKDLDIQRETRSSDWLVSLMTQAAKKFGYDRYFFQTEEPVEDDHMAFVRAACHPLM